MLKKLLIISMLAALAASAQQPLRRLGALHATLGEVITPEENTRHNLFGEVSNLHAIKFYEENDGDYQLRILAGHHLIIRRMSSDEGRRLRQLIRKRMESAALETPVEPAYALSLEKEFRERDEMIFLLGGELQTSNSTKIITENWIPSSGDAAISLGVRFFGERLAVDLAFITAASILDDASGWPFIPWVDFAVNFGN